MLENLSTTSSSDGIVYSTVSKHQNRVTGLRHSYISNGVLDHSTVPASVIARTDSRIADDLFSKSSTRLSRRWNRSSRYPDSRTPLVLSIGFHPFLSACVDARIFCLFLRRSLGSCSRTLGPEVGDGLFMVDLTSILTPLRRRMMADKAQASDLTSWDCRTESPGTALSQQVCCLNARQG